MQRTARVAVQRFTGKRINGGIGEKGYSRSLSRKTEWTTGTVSKVQPNQGNKTS